MGPTAGVDCRVAPGAFMLQELQWKRSWNVLFVSILESAGYFLLILSSSWQLRRITSFGAVVWNSNRAISSLSWLKNRSSVIPDPKLGEAKIKIDCQSSALSKFLGSQEVAALLLLTVNVNIPTQSKNFSGLLAKSTVNTGPSVLIRPIKSRILFSICCPQNRWLIWT